MNRLDLFHQWSFKSSKMQKMYFIMFLFLYSACAFKNNKTCEDNYIGRFKIKINEMVDSSQRELIRKKGWDEVELISDSTGKYYFSTDDPQLKAVEGSWYTKSTGIEGGCMGVIKQNNLTGSANLNAFSISVEIEPGRHIILPFRKILN